MKTRFAPSPTGPFHIGSLRTALLVKSLADSMNGQALLRIEDTDVQRSTLDYEKNILSSLSWAKLDMGEPIFKQSQRLDRYNSIIEHLINKGIAYPCYMSNEELDILRNDINNYNKNPNNIDKKILKYNNKFRPENWPHGIPDEITNKIKSPVIRLKIPQTGITSWIDGAKGKITINNEQLDDLIIRRSDGSPTYNFVVVVDDLDMNISHVIRGEDHINNTPKQIQIKNILTSYLPSEFNSIDMNYCHIPLMLNPDGSKISKSALANNPNAVPASCDSYIKMGILPEALINYLLLISCQKTAELIGNEIFDYTQFKNNFKPSHLSNHSAKFDLGKLKEINFHYIQKLDDNNFCKLIEHYSNFVITFNIIPILDEIKKRSKTIADSSNILLNTLHVKNNLEALVNSNQLLNHLSNSINHDNFKQIINDYAKNNNLKFGDVAKKIRAELNITSGLPLYELFIAITNNPQINNQTKFKI